MGNIKANKKILITGYFFEPENTPRAFRTAELVKEFSKRGYQIDLYIPDSYSINNKSKNCSYFFVKSKNKLSNNINGHIVNVKKRKFGKFTKSINSTLKKIVRYILGGDPRTVYYSYYLSKNLLKNSSNTNYDLIVSIGLPFYVHFATAIFIKKNKQKGSKVCDYGDPFYFNPNNKKFLILKFIEKWVLNQFDFISIPTEKSINYYTYFKDKNKIKVIPQGFDFSNVKIENYMENDIPTFCYAGTFYERLRDPGYLFDYLSSLKMDFRFIIYTRLNDQFFQETFKRYKDKLGDKIFLKDFIPREELIREMSEMDFLVNLENENSQQIPSKYIDYALSKRPILSINKASFESSIFNDFLNRIYDKALKVNIENYDIRNIVDQFEKTLGTF